jgi:transcriptional regulator with XRE-family HTH domain
MRYTPEQTEQFFDDRLLVLGITQAQFAKDAGLTPADVSRYRARKQAPRLEHIERIAHALVVDVVTLMIGLGAVDPEGKSVPRVIQNMTKESPAILLLREVPSTKKKK